jgi:hypothetical protein
MDTLTKVHVGISLVAIVSGFIVMFGLFVARQFDLWTSLFIRTTFGTSVTGFLLFHGFTPAIAIGIILLFVLAIACFARYLRELAGAWRWIYVVTAMMALYLNVFVLIVQLFQKVPALKALAPTQSEPPFAVAQLLALALFVVLTIVAAIKFRIQPAEQAIA